MKKFANREELDDYTDEYDNARLDAQGVTDALERLILRGADTAECNQAFTARLIADGYDPMDLIADGTNYCKDWVDYGTEGKN